MAGERRGEPPKRSERLGVALDRLPKAVAIVRVSDWVIVYANQRCQRMYASSAGPEGIVGKPFTASRTASGVEDFQTVIAAQLATGAEEAVYESSRQRADGEVVYIRVTVTPIDDPVDGPCWVATVEDVTAVKDAEVALANVNRELAAALSGSEGRFQAISDAGIIGVVVARDGKVLEVNEACTRLLGYSRDDFVSGRVSFSRITPPEWESITAEAIAQMQQKGYAAPYRKELLHKDGRRVPVVIAVVSLEDGQALGLIIDLTDLRKAENALRSTEEQLRQAQKMEAVGRLAGGVAHDFNNLLSIILSGAEMLKEDHPQNAGVCGDADAILDAAHRGANLTRQLLLFSRQELLEAKVFDVNEVLGRLQHLLERLVGEDVELSTACARGLGMIKADPGHMEQVVMNLVVNARDAMPLGGTIRIATAHGRMPNGSPAVVLSVRDTGSGMDAATRSRIFEPFFTTKERGKGTGLGLSTVLGIVAEAGGSIAVDSVPGGGTTFSITLPTALPVEEPPSVRPVSLAPARATETLLLVEDELQVRNLARRILAREGYRIVEADGPRQALALVEGPAAGIDLLITDVVMPKMNGVELIRELQAKCPRLRTLCMSGYTEDETARRGLRELKVPFLQKPFTPDTLRQKVREALDQ